MPEQFSITIQYKGEERYFEVTAVISTYIYQFLVTVNETDIIFERDEEGSFRAMKSPAHLHHELKETDVAMLTLIQEQIEEIFR